MCAWRNPISLAALAFAILLFCSGSVLAGEDACERLLAASPNQLLALPAVQYFPEWHPPGVSCSWERGDYRSPRACRSQSTITQDRVIGDYRLIVAGSTPLDQTVSQNSTDYVFVFTCRDGRITATTHAAFNRSEKQDYSQYASPKKSREAEYALPFVFRPPYQCPSIVIVGPGSVVKSRPSWGCTPPETTLSCGDLPAASADQLLTIPMVGWHGAGCYPESSPGACDWHAVVDEDRKMRDARRLIEVTATDRRDGRHWCSEQVYVFGCVDEEASMVFEHQFQGLKKIEPGSGKLTIVLWSTDLEDVISWTPSISWETRLTYSWSADLQNYILTDMHYGPPPPGDRLPRVEPPCIDSSPAGIGATSSP